MELRQIRQFVAVAEQMSFRKAAAALHIAQPPLSVSIRKLETELGVALFDRNTRSVHLTDAGRALLPIARGLLDQAEAFRTLGRTLASGAAGIIRLGFVGSAARELLPAIVSRTRAEDPGVRLELSESTTEAMLDAVEQSALDAALIRTPLMEARTVRLIPLQDDRLCIAVPDELGAIAREGLAALADRPFLIYPRTSALHVATVAACAAAGFVPRVVQTATQVETIYSLVRAGVGVALVPARASGSAPAGVRIAPLDPSPMVGLALAVRRDDPSPVTARLVARVIETYRISPRL